MFLLVGCRWAAPKLCASMWWLLFICVINVKTFEALASNSSGPVYDSEYLIYMYLFIKILNLFIIIFGCQCKLLSHHVTASA